MLLTLVSAYASEPVPPAMIELNAHQPTAEVRWSTDAVLELRIASNLFEHANDGELKLLNSVSQRLVEGAPEFERAQRVVGALDPARISGRDRALLAERISVEAFVDDAEGPVTFDQHTWRHYRIDGGQLQRVDEDTWVELTQPLVSRVDPTGAVEHYREGRVVLDPSLSDDPVSIAIPTNRSAAVADDTTADD